MFNRFSNATNAYNTVGVETGVASANPHQLIMMLFEGALLSIATAQGHCERNETEAKGKAISKAIDIVSNGLKASLDAKSGGEIAANLAALYDYACMRLIQSNMKDDVNGMREVAKLLGDLKDAWAQVPANIARERAREAVPA